MSSVDAAKSTVSASIAHLSIYRLIAASSEEGGTVDAGAERATEAGGDASADASSGER